MNLPTPDVRVAHILPERRPEAMKLLWERQGDETREALTQSFETESQAIGADYWCGLFGGFRGDDLIGVAWAQMHAGKAASLYGPTLVQENPTLAAQLVERAIAAMQCRGVKVVQSLGDLSAQSESAALVAAGFVRAAELLYQFCDERQFPPTPPSLRLRFESFDPKNPEPFAKVIERTYEGSLDCPLVDGVRSVTDVLAGYQATGSFDPGNWYLASTIDEPTHPIGCLLLADHPPLDQFELMYMGVVPEARGKGLGADLVQQAKWRSAKVSRKRLVLAVDEANIWGVQMYAAAGFCTFDRKVLYLKTV